MKVPWPVARCIVCLVEPDEADDQTWMTDAHVIPKSMGGRQSAAFLCRGCNSRLGTEVEAPLLADSGIRLCVEALVDRLPRDFVADLRERQRWSTETGLGQIEAVANAAGELVPPESATFRREENARAEMVAEWRRCGMLEPEIAAHLAAIEAAEPGTTLFLPGFTVRPRVELESLEFGLPFDDDPPPETLPLGIAYLFVALILGKAIYADQLAAVRKALENNDSTPSPHWRVDHRIDRRGCAPEHLLAIKDTAPVTVHVQLFQERVWWVTLAGVGLPERPPADYGVDVATGEEFRW